MNKRQKKINELNKQIQDLRYEVRKLEEEERAEKIKNRPIKPYEVWIYREAIKAVIVDARDTDEAVDEARKIYDEFSVQDYDGFSVEDATFVVGGVRGEQ